MNPKITIVVADDHPLFREGVASTLDSEADMDVVGQGESAAEAVALARKLVPDIVLLDIDMPGRGIEAAGTISSSCPEAKIIMLTVSEEEEDLMAALKAGAKGYLLKGVAGRELADVVRRVSAGEVYITPALAGSVLMELTSDSKTDKKQRAPLDELTEREREVLELLASGLSNKEIGEKMFLSEKTIKHHMTNILQKLRARNRVEAALMAHNIDPHADNDGDQV